MRASMRRADCLSCFSGSMIAAGRGAGVRVLLRTLANIRPHHFSGTGEGTHRA